MEEVRGTTNLMRLVDRLRAEMTEAYYDDNSDRMKMRRPSIEMSFRDGYHSWWGADLDLELTLTQLRSILQQHDRHLEDSSPWQENPHYVYKVWKSWNSIRIGCKHTFTDRRVMGDDGSYIGYKDSDGQTVLWSDEDE